jgi:hypothetical protein
MSVVGLEVIGKLQFTIFISMSNVPIDLRFQ